MRTGETAEDGDDDDLTGARQEADTAGTPPVTVRVHDFGGSPADIVGRHSQFQDALDEEECVRRFRGPA